MVTSNVVCRVIHLHYSGQYGTGVVLDRNGRQYVVSARHLVEQFSGGSLQIFHDNQWKQVNFELVGHADGAADISVLAPSVQLAGNYPLEATKNGIIMGQQIYFLGFPYGLKQNNPTINCGFPLPLVKGGIVSAFTQFNGAEAILLDGHNNSGFSGGPVVFQPLN